LWRLPNLGLFNALRLLLVGWSMTLAEESGRYGVICNIVLRGRVATPKSTFFDEQKAQRENWSASTVAAESAASIPVRRYGRPEEYGHVVAFPASARVLPTSRLRHSCRRRPNPQHLRQP
jgi:3-oxoacyl-[acyl-carrier protein] reductase